MAIPLIAIELATRFLPGIIGMLKGDKAEAAAKQVIDIAKGVTGKATAEEARDALIADPALAHQYRMRLLDHEEFKISQGAAERADERRVDAENLAGARVRDVDVRKLTGGENKRADAMVIMAGVGLVASLLCIVALGVIKAEYGDAVSEGVFTALLTQFANTGAYFGLCLRDAFTFEFGSSRGSRVKDEAIAITAAVGQRRE